MNLLGIDFEDWFHPELIQKYLNSDKKEPTVIQGIDKILNWLRQAETYATFFMVGELLLAKPELLDKILDGGHEIAFHTMHHTRLDSPNYEEKFDSELKKFAEITLKKSKGFRAPSFSLNKNTGWAIDKLSENNYEYDSSIVPAKTKLYGVPNAETKPYKISSKGIEREDPKGILLEFPLLTTKLFGKSIPAAGGFYIRALPLFVIENAIKQNNNNGMPASLYVHSWELTPEFMPRIPLSILDGFVTYHNLGKTLSRMDKIIKKFKFTSFSRYISKQNKN
ncbi:MAG TPA: polysaccharide deacetylase family protein [Nitrosopumilaceae archaeon]|nr:polysaccharide deacetylase family protein [Nitrosopumilaceae archaeon]